ncbi:hypothetical protein DFH11DRAFT_1723754 [Phellopilus nigrolimitatus]|nr:hypothetical protein DFH11DRAFT_1723754 [Phellopilus nigrolimitatus]
MLSSARRPAPPLDARDAYYHDAISRKRSRSLGGNMAVPMGSAYSEPRASSSHRRTASGPYHPAPAPAVHPQRDAYERGLFREERGRSSSHGHGSVGRHHSDFVPVNIAASASAPERPHNPRRATWQAPSNSAPFAPAVKIHRALACTARAPALLYDVVHAPAHNNILASPAPPAGSSLAHSLTSVFRSSSSKAAAHPLPAHTLALPATRPFVPALALALPPALGLPAEWAVRAASLSATDPAHTALTNLDVLHAVHAALRTPVARREWDALGAGSAAQKRVAEAYKRRCEALGGAQREWDAGVRRSDFLCGRTVLWGVECRSDGRCELVFGKP